MKQIRFPSSIGILALAALAALSLSSCSDARRAMGFDKTAPDEFSVMMRAPLSQPPDYTLRPPTPGAVRPQEGATRDQARTALLGRRTPLSVGEAFPDRTSGEQALLARAGATDADPEIRQVVNKETTALIDADKGFTDKIIFWRDPEKPGQVIDAQKEARRIQENAALGLPVTDGETPQIERRRKAWLEGIF